ncbi:MAG TPA: hypothetical protein VK893_09635 [Pyrinomonadaceae bacterium]|nr:hypothetical protein [Pyrinomonadaceae bacterium]
MLRTLFVLLAISLPVSAQCTQKIATLPAAPELFGFRLGMTKDEIKALVPQAVFPRADPFGVAKTTINPHFDPKIDQTKYKGVRSISLDLLDSQLTSLWIGYDDTFKVQDVDEFVKLISDSLQLSGRWSSWRSRGQQLRCGDFQLIVTTLAGGPSLRLLDAGADDTIAARRQVHEEQNALAEAAAGENSEEASEIIADKQTRTYYPNGCQPTKEISETNRAVFKSPEEAEKAGFKLAKNCQ